jgi:RNA methyltransferase, RsmD family
MRHPPGTLRIVGGQWRSRLVPFNANDGVRPTPDRVRQTLFDWLAPWLPGARCADLYAGSGALGIEALSRGAAQVQFVDRSAAQVQAIGAVLERLGAGERAQVLQHDVLALLARPPEPHRWDLVFLDPPYADDRLTASLAALRPHLAPQHRVYVEWPRGRPPAWPDDSRLLREKTAGGVSFGLLAYGDAQR